MLLSFFSDASCKVYVGRQIINLILSKGGEKLKNAKKILPALVLGLILGGVTVYKTGIVSAHFGQNQNNMAEQLAQKLNVPKDQVSGAMDQVQTENQAKRKTEFSSNLDKAVSDGTITAEQKQKILDEEAKLEQQRVDHEKWITDSGIDWSKLKSYRIGMMGNKGFNKGNND